MAWKPSAPSRSRIDGEIPQVGGFEVLDASANRDRLRHGPDWRHGPERDSNALDPAPSRDRQEVDRDGDAHARAIEGAIDQALRQHDARGSDMRSDDRGHRIAPRTHLNGATSRFVPPAAEAKDKIRERKAAFESLNAFVTKHGGFTTSISGDRFVNIDVLPGSLLPDQLRALGYRVQADGTGQRILAHAVVERFARTSSGALEPLSEGSTQAIAEVSTHAGICAVDKYWFLID
jgi:hypothetical protein